MGGCLRYSGGVGGAPDYFPLTDADIEYESKRMPGQALCRESRKRLRSRQRHGTAACRIHGGEVSDSGVCVFLFQVVSAGLGCIEDRDRAGKCYSGGRGGCMLIRREMLTRIGGIESIRSELIDDCALARRVKGAGGRVWLGTSPLEIRSVREYGRCQRRTRAMIARAAFAQLNHSTVLRLGTICGMAVIYIAPVLALFSGQRSAMGLERNCLGARNAAR